MVIPSLQMPYYHIIKESFDIDYQCHFDNIFGSDKFKSRPEDFRRFRGIKFCDCLRLLDIREGKIIVLSFN